MRDPIFRFCRDLVFNLVGAHRGSVDPANFLNFCNCCRSDKLDPVGNILGNMLGLAYRQWHGVDISPNGFLTNQNGDAITISDLNSVLLEIDITAVFCKFA